VGGTELIFDLSSLSSAPLCDVQVRYSCHGSWREGACVVVVVGGREGNIIYIE